MDNAVPIDNRKAFLSRFAEQFLELADEIGESYRAEFWGGDTAADAAFRIVREWECEKREILQVVARFVEGGKRPRIHKTRAAEIFVYGYQLRDGVGDAKSGLVFCTLEEFKTRLAGAVREGSRDQNGGLQS